MYALDERRELLSHEHTRVQQLRAVSDEYLDLLARRQKVMDRRDHAAASLALYGSNGSAPWHNARVRDELGHASHNAWNNKALARLREAFPITDQDAPATTMKLWKRYGQVPPMVDALAVLRQAVSELSRLDGQLDQVRCVRDEQMVQVALMFPTISLSQLAAAVGISRQAINLILRQHQVLWDGTRRYNAAVPVRRSRWAES